LAKVEFLGPIGIEAKDYDVSSLKDLKELLAQDEKLKEWLDICAVAINDEIVKDLKKPLNSSDKVSLLPPVCGG